MSKPTCRLLGGGLLSLALLLPSSALGHELAEAHEHIAQNEHANPEHSDMLVEGEPGVVHTEAAHGEAAHAGAHGEAAGAHGGGHHGAVAPPPINWFQWHGGKDILGGTLEEGEEPMPPGMLFALFNFAVFLTILIKAAGPKITAYLRSNHDKVKSQLEEAALLRKQAQDKLAEYEQRLSSVDADVQKLIGEIRDEAAAEKEAILAQAKSQAEAMKKDAERRIESEIARARGALEQEVVNAAVAAAENILRERTNQGDQVRMFDTFLDTLSKGQGGGKGPSGPGGSGPAGTPTGGGPDSGRTKRETKVDEEWA